MRGFIGFSVVFVTFFSSFLADVVTGRVIPLSRQDGETGTDSIPSQSGDEIVFADGKYKMTFVRNISIPHVGYTFLPEELPRGTMLVTGFDATPYFGKDGVYLVDVNAKDPSPVLLTDKIDWPNEVTVVPDDVFGFSAAIVGAGFLVPSHGTGGVWVVELSDKTPTRGPYQLTKKKNGWFYHKGVLRDMNGDGHLDVVTCRCTDSVFPWSSKASELLWLENPGGDDPLSRLPWTEHVMHNPGPDFLFNVAPQQVAPAGVLGVVGAEYIRKQVSYYYSDATTGNVTERVIDADSGPGFMASFEDINGDGSMDILATNHLNQNGSVFAYTWHGDLRTAIVTKHVLATGFNAVSKSTGTAAPGAAQSFRPCKDSTKSYVLVSEDNGNAVSLLVPKGETIDDWTYTRQELLFLGADIGQFSIADVDDDGCEDIFIPAYDAGHIVHYSISRA